MTSRKRKPSSAATETAAGARTRKPVAAMSSAASSRTRHKTTALSPSAATSSSSRYQYNGTAKPLALSDTQQQQQQREDANVRHRSRREERGHFDEGSGGAHGDWRYVNRLLGQTGFGALPLDARTGQPSDASVQHVLVHVLTEYDRRGALLQSLIDNAEFEDKRAERAEASLAELERALDRSNRALATTKAKLAKYRAYIERKWRERKAAAAAADASHTAAAAAAAEPSNRAQAGDIHAGADAETEMQRLMDDLKSMLRVDDHHVVTERVLELQTLVDEASWLAEFVECVRAIVEEGASAPAAEETTATATASGSRANLSEEQVLDELEKWAVERLQHDAHQAASRPAPR